MKPKFVLPILQDIITEAILLVSARRPVSGNSAVFW